MSKNKNTHKPRAILYLRQSIAREESISLELQEDAGRRYATQQGYEVIGVEADEGISGRTWHKRPAIQRVMAQIESGEADVIILWKWSRLSRSRLDWAIAIDKVEASGGRIESATEQVDVSTSTGRFARGMLAEFAAFESERIGDTWKEAHQRRVERGLPANGKPRFGYQYDKETGFTPHPVEGPVLQECYRRYLQGQSLYDIVDYLKAGPTLPGSGYTSAEPHTWSVRTLRRVMDNPFATGRFNSRGEVIQGIHEPLISMESWEEYQVVRKSRQQPRKASKLPRVYTGMLFCGICGYGMYGHMFGKDGTLKYRCSGAGNFRLHSGGYVMASTVDKDVLAWLTNLASDINREAATTPATLPKAPDNTPTLRRALMKLEAKLDSLTDRMLDGTVPQDVYARLRDQMLSEKKTLEGQLLESRVEQRVDPMHLPADLIGVWPELSVESRQEILRRVVKKIVVMPGRPRSSIRIVARWEEDS